MKHLSFAVIGLTVLIAGWFFLSPLFIDQTVDEDFSFVLDGGGVDMQAVMSMPDDERLSMMSDIMDEAARAPDSVALEAMPSSAPTVLASGEFSDADTIHKGSGQATLYQLPDGRHVIRFEAFRTTNGPALVVYLAKHVAPSSAADVVDGGFVKLGKLKGNVGNQNYDVPSDVIVSDYNSVVVWCELFDVLFSPASLNRI